MHIFDQYYSVIDEIKEHFDAAFIGPSDENEVLDNEPLGEYDMGILWNQTERTRPDAEMVLASELEVSDVEEFEDELEEMSEIVGKANIHKPSAMAVTVMVRSDTTLSVSFSFAVYERYAPEKGKPIYTRIPMNLAVNVMPKDEVSSSVVAVNEFCEISVHVRAVYADGSKQITVSAINLQSGSASIVEASVRSLFQCRLSLECDSGFLPLYKQMDASADSEDLVNDMLYRNVHSYAYGHGCSVKYDDSDVVCKVESEFVPVSRLLQMVPSVLQDDRIMQMQFWTMHNRVDGCRLLRGFVTEYERWAISISDRGQELSEHITAVGITEDNLMTCITRIRGGIRLLEENDIAWQAFVLMNEAMLLQRLHTKIGCAASDVKWYPFQLAYVLQIIPDIVDENSIYRDYADLLWFPTGGGKTEAYLAVAAFVIFFRRLTNKLQQDGVAIIMRYTLRLLTIQQFERASALICACEIIRKREKLGGGEISIGLWIGSSMTPNRIEKAKDALEKLKADPDAFLPDGNPVQVTKCPWCGAKIDIGGYNADQGSMTIRCHNNESCEFYTHLPVYLVDDDIYQKKPTLVLSTVDKFARLAWEPASGSILGNGAELPPDLIIQDELHLISGPLGTLTGVYECAVDEICRHNGKTPKIIASTATARNSAEQIKTLYNRKSFQFPPNGIDYNDSFFAVSADKYSRPARTYIGLCENGGSPTDLLIKVNALLLYLKNLFIKKKYDPRVVDHFYTTVGYFNSLKDLGTSSSILSDRIMAEVHSLISHKFRDEAEQHHLTVKDIRKYQHNSELTSRKSSLEIKKVLEQLDVRYTDDSCLSYVLASNMLSVGIDIDRLGVMTMYGQPKSNSEYIQSTSRVGRSAPGLVIAVYNPLRSRDKSHYEQFPYYHKTFYEYVEATSVTSFSARAIEKALHCTFISMIRHIADKFNPNESAGKYRRGDLEIEKIKSILLKRVGEISPLTVDFAGKWLDYFLECWEEQVNNSGGNLVFNAIGTEKIGLYISAENTDAKHDTPKILNSVRNVQPTSDVYVIRR